MTKSMLTSVRAAFSGGATDQDPETGERGDEKNPSLNSHDRSETMSENEGAPAAKELSGTTQETNPTAIESARAEGVAEGASAANQRMSDIMAADGIKGNGKRMAAALDLAIKSPDMSAQDVSGFVTGNVADDSTNVADYEAGRQGTTTTLAKPQGTTGKPKASGLDRKAIYAQRRNAGA